MKQIVNNQTPTIAKLTLGQIETGFFRWSQPSHDEEGRIFYAGQWGKYTVFFPVLENGMIYCKGYAESPRREADMVNPKDLGIKKAVFEKIPEPAHSYAVQVLAPSQA